MNLRARPRNAAHLYSSLTPAALELSAEDIAWLNQFANWLAQQRGIIGSYYVGTFSTKAVDARPDICPMSVMFSCVWPWGTMSRHAIIRLLPSTRTRDLGFALDLAFDLVDKGGVVKRTETVWGMCSISLF